MLGESLYRFIQWLSIDRKHFITFRNMTIAVVVVWTLNLSLIVWGTRPSEFPTATAKYFEKMCALAHSPLLILLNFAFVGFGLWIVRRYRSKYYIACVVFYGMLIGNILGMVDGWVSCHLFFIRRVP